MNSIKLLSIFIYTNVFIENTDPPKPALNDGFVFQFAGSAGFGSVGYLINKNNTELSLSYGYTPKFAGGDLHSLNLKLLYNFKTISLGKAFEFSPLLVGGFVSMTFNENLSVKWPKFYAEDYYWWQRNFRQHILIGSQVDVLINNSVFKRIAFYLEANTNDLYLISLITNPKTIKLYDIIFFGAGIKLF